MARCIIKTRKKTIVNGGLRSDQQCYHAHMHWDSTAAARTHTHTRARAHARAHTHTHTHTFNGPMSGTTRVSAYQKGKPMWILLKQETASGSGNSWTICKSAPRSRQITMPAPHHSVFTGRMPFLPPNQQCQSTEGRSTERSWYKKNMQ